MRRDMDRSCGKTVASSNGRLSMRPEAEANGRRRTVGGQAMRAVATLVGSPGSVAHAASEATPGPLPRPPGRPPPEPIVIKVPPGPREHPEIDRSNDEDEEKDDGI